MQLLLSSLQLLLNNVLVSLVMPKITATVMHKCTLSISIRTSNNPGKAVWAIVVHLASPCSPHALMSLG